MDKLLPRHPALAFWVMSIIALLLYSGIYILHPFSTGVNEFFLNVVYLAAVTSPAVIASAVQKEYDSADTPMRIWKCFAYGFWSWSLAELIWVIYRSIMGEVPLVNLSAPFYLVGYVLMTLAVTSQYVQTRHQGSLSERAIVMIVWITMLLVSMLLFFVTVLVPSANLSLADYVGGYLNILYGVGDMTLAITAVLMVVLFQGGALGRPWWGFITLAVADAFYGWLIQTGAHAYETLGGNLLRLTSDLIYMCSYLMIAYSFLRQYVLLRFGPSERFLGKAR